MLDLFLLDFVQSALLICVIIGVTLSYLGVHVVGRGIVFVDLALGQISMLGVAVAEYLELEPTTVSIGFTLVGALLLSFLKVSDDRLKLEAIIGIFYAFSSALTVLFISKAAHGDSDISEVLFGSFFTVTDDQILYTSVIFGLILLFHFVFRKRFFSLTDMYRKGGARDIGGFDPWNLGFYLTLGLTIVLAVRIGGVIPVFSFLVVPAVSAILLVGTRSRVIFVGILIALMGSFLGIYFSISFDFPAGSSVVAVLGFIFMLSAAVRLLLLWSTRRRLSE